MLGVLNFFGDTFSIVGRVVVKKNSGVNFLIVGGDFYKGGGSDFFSKVIYNKGGSLYFEV